MNIDTAVELTIADRKERLRSTWMLGEYDVFSRHMEAGARQFYERLGIESGAHLLDIGCGSGQLALIAARAGARVKGCDIATNWLDIARRRAAEENLPILFEEGDAEALPYATGEFDVVVSLLGAMFASRPELAAAEMTRVCRPGGRIIMANWTPGGFIGQMFKTIAKHIAPPGMPSPVLWGDEETVRVRLREGIAGLRMTRRQYPFRYPFGPEAVVDFFRANYGPMSRAFSTLGPGEQKALRRDLTLLWAGENRSVCESTAVDAEYLEVVATRTE